MDKKVDIAGWVKWIWSLWPAGWIGLGILIFTILVSIGLGSLFGGGPAYVIVWFPVIMSEFIFGMIGYVIYKWYEENWVRVKKKIGKWWKDRPQ